MIDTLIFATSNVHKIAEVRDIAGSSVHILSMKDVGLEHVTLEETADTLQGNAEQKVRALHSLVGKDCFAEDTGLEVDALYGAPGVFTARYAGDDCDPKKNIAKLLHELQGCTVRSARFRTVIGLIIKDKLHFFEGTVEGYIAESPMGTAGFGYDPVFIPEGHSHTFGELSAGIKNALSHRAKAMHRMLDFLSLASGF